MTWYVNMMNSTMTWYVNMMDSTVTWYVIMMDSTVILVCKYDGQYSDQVGKCER